MPRPPARRLAPSELGALDLSFADPRIGWALRARASSRWSEGYSATSACGPPAVFPRGGDHAGTWLADANDASPWLELDLPELRQAHVLLICETCGAGGVATVRDQDGAALYTRGRPSKRARDRAHLLAVPLDPSSPAPTRIRIEMTAADHYQEIDAVGLATVSLDTLLEVPADRGAGQHRRYPPSEVPVKDLRGDPRLVWARGARASSQYSSDYSAKKALGPPRVFPRGGDHSRTWLSRTDDRNAWLEVTFPDPPAGALDCHGFVVLETCGAGAVVRVTDERDELLWQSGPEKVPDREARLLHVSLTPGPPPKRLRLHVSPAVRDYREIDGIALLFAPFAALATDAPPPPPPPIPGAPSAGFTFLEGTLIGVSPTQPLVHATLRTMDGGHARTWGPPLHLRPARVRASGDPQSAQTAGTAGASRDMHLRLGHESADEDVELELEETSVFGDPLPRRRGAFRDIAEAFPELANLAAPSPDAQVLVEGQTITNARRVYVAGVPTGVREGGFRERGGSPERMAVAAISLEPLSTTPFLREGIRTFTASAEKIAARVNVPHPLRGWILGFGVAAGVTTTASLLAVTARQSTDPGLLAFLFSLALCALVFVLELVGRAHTVCVIARRGRSVSRNGRVGFGSPGWTLTGASLTVGIAIVLLSVSLASTDPEADGPWLGALVVAGSYALVRALMWQRTAGPVLVTALRALRGTSSTGALLRAHRSTERLVAHVEFLGTEQYTDDRGETSTRDRYRTWNDREVHADEHGWIALPDGTRVGPTALACVIDVGMLPEVPSTQPRQQGGTVYAAFGSDHGIGDVASLVGEHVGVDPRKVNDAILLLGPRAALLRGTMVQAACMFGLWAIAVAGIATLLVGLWPFL